MANLALHQTLRPIAAVHGGTFLVSPTGRLKCPLGLPDRWKVFIQQHRAAIRAVLVQLGPVGVPTDRLDGSAATGSTMTRTASGSQQQPIQ